MQKNGASETRPTKVYRIEREQDTGTISMHVGVGGPAGIHRHALRHCNLHSPTGFEVGYPGSGPADTAASILADYFGENPSVVERAWRGHWQESPSIAVKLHQFFKFDVIASIRVEPGKSYTIDESRVTAWLVERHPEYLNPLQSVSCAACAATLWREPDISRTLEAWHQAVQEFNLEHRHHSKGTAGV